MPYALISGNRIEKNLTRFEAIRAKRWAKQIILPYKKESDLDGIPILKLKDRKSKKKKADRFPGEWDWSKLSDDQQFELLKAYEEKNYPVIKDLVIKNKVMSSCGTCSYTQVAAMEWIKYGLENGRL